MIQDSTEDSTESSTEDSTESYKTTLRRLFEGDHQSSYKHEKYNSELNGTNTAGYFCQNYSNRIYLLRTGSECDKQRVEPYFRHFAVCTNALNAIRNAFRLLRDTFPVLRDW